MHGLRLLAIASGSMVILDVQGESLAYCTGCMGCGHACYQLTSVLICHTQGLDHLQRAQLSPNHPLLQKHCLEGKLVDWMSMQDPCPLQSLSSSHSSAEYAHKEFDISNSYTRLNTFILANFTRVESVTVTLSIYTSSMPRTSHIITNRI